MKQASRGYTTGPNPRPQNFNPYMRPSAHYAVPQPYAFMADMEGSSAGAWYPDSGASHHLTYNPNNLAYRVPYNGQDQVLMGNGQGVSIQSLGQSQFNSPHKPNVQLTLKDLLHVPNISKNLLSVSKFAQDNNVIFEFHPYRCFVKSQGSNQVLLEGTVGADGLYQFQPFKFLTPSGASSHSPSSLNAAHSDNKFVKCTNASILHNSPIDNTLAQNVAHSDNKSVKCINVSALHNSPLDNTFTQLFGCNKAATARYNDFTSPICTFPTSVYCNNNSSVVSNENEFQMWHLRLGHANTLAVKSVLQLCNVPFSNKNTNLSCTFCCMGKSHRQHAPLSTTVYTKPFEVIHCDLWGPAPFVSHYGYNYYITFVDTFTKYTWVYFLKTKADALNAFSQFLALVQNQFQSTIKALQSDWGENLDLLPTYSITLGFNID
jgi:hypothetical protein